MNLLKRLFKPIFSYKSQHKVEPVKKLVYLGSANHGYYVPDNYLSGSSVCYCVGAGTDISLDTELATRFGAQVFVFDPMPYAVAHFEQVVAHAKAGRRFTADTAENGYVYSISREALTRVTYCPVGVWNEQKTIRFYVPTQQSYAGHSITNLQNTSAYIEAPVDRLAALMHERGHEQLDLLKLEIEGSEYTVIDNMLAEKLDVKILLVEFDEYHHRRGVARLVAIRHIEQATRQLLRAGYKLVQSSGFYKRTFVRADVFAGLAR